MPQIIPIKDLKNTSEISDMCHKTDEPIYVTKNGYGDMVIMSMESYESTMKQLTLYKDIEISQRQIELGQVKDADNPRQVPESRNPYLAKKGYREAVVSQMNYVIVFDVRKNVVNVVGVFHQLENYQRKL